MQFTSIFVKFDPETVEKLQNLATTFIGSEYISKLGLDIKSVVISEKNKKPKFPFVKLNISKQIDIKQKSIQEIIDEYINSLKDIRLGEETPYAILVPHHFYLKSGSLILAMREECRFVGRDKRKNREESHESCFIQILSYLKLKLEELFEKYFQDKKIKFQKKEDTLHTIYYDDQNRVLLTIKRNSSNGFNNEYFIELMRVNGSNHKNYEKLKNVHETYKIDNDRYAVELEGSRFIFNNTSGRSTPKTKKSSKSSKKKSQYQFDLPPGLLQNFPTKKVFEAETVTKEATEVKEEIFKPISFTRTKSLSLSASGDINRQTRRKRVVDGGEYAEAIGGDAEAIRGEGGRETGFKRSASVSDTTTRRKNSGTGSPRNLRSPYRNTHTGFFCRIYLCPTEKFVKNDAVEMRTNDTKFKKAFATAIGIHEQELKAFLNNAKYLNIQYFPITQTRFNVTRFKIEDKEYERFQTDYDSCRAKINYKWKNCFVFFQYEKISND